MTPALRSLLFCATAFCSAFLLFVAQPMAARMALPRLGGSPAVWVSCQLFFQAALLAGYWYAHAASSRLAPVPLARLHAGLLVLGALMLPLGLPPGWTAPSGGLPVLALLGALAAHGGLPLLAVCSSAPLLQRWYARSGRDPYYLYAASNAGSFAALACYPALLEPALRLSAQSRLWSAGYAVFAALTAACMLAAAPSSAEPAAPPAPAPPVPWARKLGWLALAFAPASVSLGATSYVTANIAPVPLFWVLPLGIYLASFVFAFSRRAPGAARLAAWAAPVLLLLVMRTLLLSSDSPLLASFLAHLAALAALSMALHARLADDRPPEAGLTEYYLWLAGGGALAGLFHAVAAPLLLVRPLEYPLSLCLAALLLPTVGAERGRLGPWAAALLAAGLALSPIPKRLGLQGFDAAALILVYVAATLRLDLRPGLAALGLCAGWAADGQPSVLRDRSFFGAIRVGDFVSSDQERLRQLMHGNTTHGMQSFDRPLEPLTYYHQESGVGRAILAMCGKKGTTCPATAVIGLGSGTLAAYTGTGYQMDFYEIDPMIARLVQTSRHFSYLADARRRGAELRVILGDGRLRLAEAPDASYGLIVVDAFGSDSIPTHLLTREAFQLYLSKLEPGGIVAVHVSNRYLRLAPVVGDVARELRLNGRIHASEQLDEAAYASVWVAVGKTPQSLLKLTPRDGWAPLTGVPGRPAWEDERLNLLSAVGW